MRYALCILAIGASLALGGGGFGVDPTAGGGSSWWIDGRDGYLVRGADGGMRCRYMGWREPTVPAMEDWGGEWRCPDVTVRHLVSVDISRHGGECGGMVCGYDVGAGGRRVLVTDPWEWCPDVLVTVSYGGRVRVVAEYEMGEWDSPDKYFRGGRMPDMEFVVEPALARCGGERYRRKLRYWLGEDYLRPGDRVVEWEGEDPGGDWWDGT